MHLLLRDNYCYYHYYHYHYHGQRACSCATSQSTPDLVRRDLAPEMSSTTTLKSSGWPWCTGGFDTIQSYFFGLPVWGDNQVTLVRLGLGRPLGNHS